MTGKALICELGEIQDIDGADRIGKVEMFGETLIVSKEYNKGDLGLLFDCETQLSDEYVSANNMYRNSEKNSDIEKSGYIEDKRRVKPISMKGIKVSGLWMPIESLSFISPYFLEDDLPSEYSIGDQIDSIYGTEVCSKYIPPQTQKAQSQNKQGKARASVPTFKEHFDTDYWERRNSSPEFGNTLIITEKVHGTSFRCGNLIAENSKGKVLRWLFNLLKIDFSDKYKFVVGSRRVTKSIDGEVDKNKQHYYDHDLWTEVCTPAFKGKLHKGEVIYGEIVGYDLQGGAIMGTHSNEKLKKFMSKKDYQRFIDRYGEKTVFNYDCYPVNKKTAKELRKAGVILDSDIDDNQLLQYGGPQNKLYVYRISQVNEDGHTVDLSWQQMKNRCDELHVDHVPQLYKTFVDEDFDIRDFSDMVDFFTKTDSTNFPDHLNEGVCVRVESRGYTPKIYKSKRWEFKVLEGIIKDTEHIDIEEAN